MSQNMMEVVEKKAWNSRITSWNYLYPVDITDRNNTSGSWIQPKAINSVDTTRLWTVQIYTTKHDNRWTTICKKQGWDYLKNFLSIKLEKIKLFRINWEMFGRLIDPLWHEGIRVKKKTTKTNGKTLNQVHDFRLFPRFCNTMKLISWKQEWAVQE